ncbi:hypothetical protein FA13DRAFT_1799489 [Coprinellus micaceus]|uniref:DUF5648 domain-containing protein n=1 Tax=Coprinellus micaceus TaxID=71717 RepID=A0A4Y7SJ18_COPMI|nr:hypothetical protein FA13DRAFT_1799489 [Coprinellus micaceus]
MATSAPQNAGSATPALAPTGHALPFYRSFNGLDHLYTTNHAEYKDAVALATLKRHRGYIFPSYEPRTVPLYRLYRAQNGGDHFYTTGWEERDNATDNLGYVDEGLAGWVFPDAKSGGVSLYRLYNGEWQDHFYTVSTAEADNAEKNLGFQKEGIAAYIYPF